MAVLHGFSEFYLVLLGFTGFYWVLLGFTGFYWVLLGFTGFYWDVAWFKAVLRGFSEFYLLLLVFSGFCYVLLGSTGFCWVALGLTVSLFTKLHLLLFNVSLADEVFLRLCPVDVRFIILTFVIHWNSYSILPVFFLQKQRMAA